MEDRSCIMSMPRIYVENIGPVQYRDLNIRPEGIPINNLLSRGEIALTCSYFTFAAKCRR